MSLGGLGGDLGLSNARCAAIQNCFLVLYGLSQIFARAAARRQSFAVVLRLP